MKTIAQQINWDFEQNGDLEIRDKNGRQLYIEGGGYWSKSQYDSYGNEIYYENSIGVIKDNLIPEIFEHPNGRKYKLIP